MSEVTLFSYSEKTPNANCMRVTIGDLDLYFSYNTVVAFRFPGMGLVVRENVWSVTTAKHLNWIDGGNKADRLSADAFARELARVQITVAEEQQGVTGREPALSNS